MISIHTNILSLYSITVNNNMIYRITEYYAINRYFFIQKFHDLQYTPIYSKQTVLEKTFMTTETTRYVSWMIYQLP